MQQVDDVGIWKVPQEPPSEEPMRDVDEGTPSPDSPEKVDGPVVLSLEGRSGAESAPASPQGPLSADAEEDLVNGEVQDGRLFGNGCSPEEAKAQVAPVAGEKGDHWPHQGGSEAASTTSPAGQSLDSGKAPAGRQRKLAMEERVIRDHLGQEVGCMDAVGQSQSSLEKEEELGGHRGLEGRRNSWGQPGPVDGVSEGPLDSRDGPEGESPTSQGPQSPSRVLQNENGCAKGPGDGPLEVGSLAKEASGSGGGQKAMPEQGALETDSTLALAAGDAPAMESTKQSQGSPRKTSESLELGAAEKWQEPSHLGSQLEPLTESLPHQFPPVQEVEGLSPQEEAQIPLLDPALPPLPAQIPALPQEAAPSPPGTTESLLDQVSFQESQGPLLGPELLLPASQSPPAPLEQNSSSPERKGSLLDLTPPAMQEGLSGKEPPALQGALPSPLEGGPPGVQGEPPLLLPDVVHSATDQVASSLQEAERALASWSPAPLGAHTASLPDQPSSLLAEGGPGALQCIPFSGHGTEEPAPQQGLELLQHEEVAPLPQTLHSSSDPLSALPEQMGSLLDAKTPALEESPQVALQDQTPVPPELRVPPLPEDDACLPSQTPPPLTAPGESPAAVPDQLPPVPQDTESSSPAGENPASSLQAADGALPDEIQAPLPSHTSPPLPEEEELPPDQGPAMPEDPAAASLLGQSPPSQEAAKSLSEGQHSPDDPEEHTSSPDKPPGPVLQETPSCPNSLPSSQETLQPLPDKSRAVEDPGAKGSGNASMALAGAGGATEVLGNLHAERQPLLQEAKGSGGVSAGDLPPKTGAPKPLAATSNQTPNDSGTRSPTKTAYAPQLQAALPRQGPDPEPEKGKRKSCQCCALM